MKKIILLSVLVFWVGANAEVPPLEGQKENCPEGFKFDEETQRCSPKTEMDFNKSVGLNIGYARAVLFDEKRVPIKYFNVRSIGKDEAEFEAMYKCGKEIKSELNQYCEIEDSGEIYY